MSNQKDEKLSNTESKNNNGEFEEHDHNECDCNHHEHNHNHEHHHEHHPEHHPMIKLELDDGTELDCPIIDIFEVNGKEYIALLHPIEETALIYCFYENEDETIELTLIEDDKEYEMVSNTFMSLLGNDGEDVD